MSVGALEEREEIAPWVKFETRPMEDKKATIAAGHVVYKDVDFVLVTPPYSKDVIEHKVEHFFSMRENDVKNKRMPQKWLDTWKEGYQRWKEGQEIPEHGISIKNWPGATPAEVKNMLSAGIRTIEMMAACNDEGLRRLGMGGQALKQRAKSFLSTAKNKGKVAEENAALHKENERLQRSVDNLSEQVQLLKTQIEGLSQGEAVSVSRGTIDIDDLVDPPKRARKKTS